MVSLRFLTASAISAAAPLVLALTAQEIVGNINELTTLSQALQAPAQSITVLNGPLILIGQGPFPQIIAGFTDIITTATANNAMMEDQDHLTSEADATAAANAFNEFTRVSQVILNILIGKGGLFSANPLIGVPMTVVLHQLQTVLDGTAFNLIDIIDSPNQKSRVSSNRSSIASYIYTAVATYLDLSLKKVKRGFVA